MSAPAFNPNMPPGYGFVYRDTIDSTNEEAHRLALAGENGPLWIAAGRQTAGRGRRGRAWVSPEGNLMASLLLSLTVTPAVAAQISFVAGLAVYDMVTGLTHRVESTTLKWPNDVLLDGRKVAGILLEASRGPENRTRLVTGVGVNLAYYPENALYPAISIAAVTGVAPLYDEAFGRLAHTFAVWFDAWAGGEGFDGIRAAWLERAAGLGEMIQVNLPSATHEGIFSGLDEQGALILEQKTGKQRYISAGDVFFQAHRQDAL